MAFFLRCSNAVSIGTNAYIGMGIWGVTNRVMFLNRDACGGVFVRVEDGPPFPDKSRRDQAEKMPGA
jgi:hypothetical protein